MRTERNAYGLQRLAAGNDQGSRRIEGSGERRQFASDPLRGLGARQVIGKREFHKGHAAVFEFALNAHAAFTFGQRNCRLTARCKLRCGCGLIRAEQSEHGPLKLRRSIGAMIARKRTGQTAAAAPEHRSRHASPHFGDAVEIEVALGVEDLNTAL